MSELRDLIGSHITMIRTAKQRSLKSGVRDISPQIVLHRRGRLLASIIHADPVGAEEIMSFASLCAKDFAADIAIVSFENIVSTLQVHPLTGKPLTSDELPELLTHPDSVELGWTQEQISLLGADRHGNTIRIEQPYILGDRLTWLTPKMAAEDFSNLRKHMVEKLSEAMQEVTANGQSSEVDIQTAGALMQSHRCVVTVVDASGQIIFSPMEYAQTHGMVID